MKKSSILVAILKSNMAANVRSRDALYRFKIIYIPWSFWVAKLALFIKGENIANMLCTQDAQNACVEILVYL